MYSISAKIPYDIQDLIPIITEVELYPNFIPWCKKISIIHKDKKNIIARVSAGFGLVKVVYISNVKIEECIEKESKYSIKNENNYDNKSIRYASVVATSGPDGPFNNLETRWLLNSSDQDYTEISFWINFKFKSKIKQKMAMIFMNDIADTTVKAFINRAHNTIGEKNKKYI